MQLINCRKCKRLFSSENGETLCSRCNDTVDIQFSKVREYIYDNKSAGIKEVSQGTGVAADSILKWIREGKIVLAEGSPITFCEKCDEPSDGQRLCGRCLAEISGGLKEGLAEKIVKEAAQNRGGLYIKRR